MVHLALSPSLFAYQDLEKIKFTGWRWQKCQVMDTVPIILSKGSANSPSRNQMAPSEQPLWNGNPFRSPKTKTSKKTTDGSTIRTCGGEPMGFLVTLLRPLAHPIVWTRSYNS